ncbi:MAG: class I SAM-dependent RNA methyltransferase [Actinomycetota bacterium]
MDNDSLIGHIVNLDVGQVAHGGHCIARWEGRAVFVRHSAPGERVRARITEGTPTSRYLRADAVEIHTPSPHRVLPQCSISGPGGCGGCDWQHLDLKAQRELKATVVHEQFARLAGLDVHVVVEPVPAESGGDSGVGWRTRVRHAVTEAGRLAMRAHRSHQLIPIVQCPIADPAIRTLQQTTPPTQWRALMEQLDPAGTSSSEPFASVTVLAPSGSPQTIALMTASAGNPGSITWPATRQWVTERVTVKGESQDFRVRGGGFWQSHRGAPALLTQAILEALKPKPGEQALDLYSGVGLFAAFLARAVGRDGGVLAIESDSRAVRDARRSLHDVPQIELVHGRVDRVLAARRPKAKIIVLDPPRKGAGRRVVQAVAGSGARAIAYVSCDPASLARDVALFLEYGYELTQLRAFDCFPMTHHVECLATLVPVDVTRGSMGR